MSVKDGPNIKVVGRGSIVRTLTEEEDRHRLNKIAKEFEEKYIKEE